MSETITKPLNKQLYENSGLKELFAATSGEADAVPVKHTAFFNRRDPNLAIMHEKPEHRLLIMLKAQGASNREIAQQTGYTEPWISQLMRQPWAQQLLSDLITQSGLDEVTQLLKGACADSVKKLIEVRDSPTSPPAVVRATCVDLIQQYLGKPRERVQVTTTAGLAAGDIAELDRKINENEQEISRLTGVASGSA